MFNPDLGRYSYSFFYHLDKEEIPGLEVMKYSSCSTQLNMKFIMLINV